MGIKVNWSWGDFHQSLEELPINNSKNNIICLKMNKALSTVLFLLVVSVVIETKAASLGEAKAESLNEATKQQIFHGK